MNATERAGIQAGRRIEVDIRGRRFYAVVTGRSGGTLTIEPEQPPRPGKGSRINHFACDISDVEWAAKLKAAWTPMDAVRSGA